MPGSPLAHEERKSDRDPRAWGPTGYLVTAALVLLGLAYVRNGVKTLTAPNYQGDYTTRWRERRYLSLGIDPYDVSVQFKGMQPNTSELARIARHHLENEPAIDPSGYPPWGLAASFLFIPPGSQRMGQFVFCGMCLCALGISAWYAYAAARRWGTGPALLMSASVLAMFGNASTLRLGQFGLLLNALLAISLLQFTRQKQITSGLAMAVASIKPNYSLFQLAVMVFRRQWIAVGVVALICAAACLVPWALTGVNPIEMTEQLVRQSAYVSEADTSLLRPARLIMPYSLAVAGLGMLSFIVTMLLGWRYRKASPLIAASAAAVLGRVCLYHRQYDNVMLMFPLLALGLLALSNRRVWMWIAFAAYGATLWVPIPYLMYRPPVIFVLSLVWVSGLAIICRHANLLAPSPAKSGTDPAPDSKFPVPVDDASSRTYTLPL
jgi:hypothetical protein